MTKSIPAPLLIWIDLSQGTINLNFPKQNWDKNDKKNPAANIRILVEVQGCLERLSTLNLRNPAIFLARLFFCGLPACTCTPSLGWRALPVGESGLAKLPHKNTPAHIFATGYTNSRWKHPRAAKIFLPAGRQFAEGLTLQGSARILSFFRCFVFSGPVWDKGWKKEHWLGVFSRHNAFKRLKSVFRVRLQKML